jgi:hypothetical protein
VPGDEDENVQEGVAAPPDGTLALEGQDTVTPGGTETLRLTVPENPKRLESVIVPLVEVPDRKEIVEPDILKSVMVTGRTAELVSDPLVPVIVTL